MAARFVQRRSLSRAGRHRIAPPVDAEARRPGARAWPTCRSRQAIGPSFLPRSAPGEFEVVLLDLDIDPGTAPTELCAQVAAACHDTPIVVLAGRRRAPAAGAGARPRRRRRLRAQDRRLDARSRPRSDRATSSTGPTSRRSAWRCAAAASARRSRPDRRPICSPARRSRSASSAARVDKDEALAGAARRRRAASALSDEKLRRVETAADELMLNAVYDAPRDERGHPLHADIDRRTPVTLTAQAQVRVRWGCDGRTFVVSVADRFGALERATVCRAHPAPARRALAAPRPHARPRRQPDPTGGAGLGAGPHLQRRQRARAAGRAPAASPRPPPRCTSPARTAPPSRAARALHILRLS